MSDEDFDDWAMTGARGQHKSCLSVAIAGVHIYALSKQIKNGWDLTSLDHIFPCAIHRSSLPSLCSVSLKHCSLTRPRDKLRAFPAILPQKEHIRLLRFNMTIPR